MIIITESRRLWEVDHKVEAISDTEIKITIDDKEEIVSLSGIEEGEDYILSDSLILPYNPIQGIKKMGDNIEVSVFYDDPHIRGIESPFKKANTEIGYLITVEQEKEKAIRRISDLSVQRNYELLPQYKRDNIYAGIEACSGYPEYLIGDAGKQTIAKMNGYFRQRTKDVSVSILSATMKKSVKEIAEIDPFPKTAEEMLALLNS